MELGQPSRQIAIRRHHYPHARQRASEHQGFVSGSREIGAQTRAVADDRDAVIRRGARVAAAQNRRTIAGFEQPARNESGKRRLAAAARGQAANTDDGPIESPNP